MRLKKVFGQPSWLLQSDRVSLAVTQLGGFIAPVDFRLGRRTISPYSLPPWAGKKHPPPGGLGALRGDGFCLPFGANKTPFRGKKFPAHGEPFHRRWTVVEAHASGASSELVLELPLRLTSGLIRKTLRLRRGETVLYQTHRIVGLTGQMSHGYHATLDFTRHGSGRIATSPVKFGRTQPRDFEDPAAGGYCSLRPETVFRRLDRVPRGDGTAANLTRYPAENGYENLVLLANDPATALAWTTVTFTEEGWVWFSLKRPQELSCTLLWLSNGGRHYAPWNGAHRSRLGLEEITALPEGLAESVAPNIFSRRGIAVCRNFRADETHLIRAASGVCRVPRNFDRVKSLRLRGGQLELRAHSGAIAATAFDCTFFDAPSISPT